MFLLTDEHIEDLSIGSAILGSGGGGDPIYAKWMLRHALEQYGPVTIRPLESLTSRDLVVPLALMGAPLISMEKVLSGKELEGVLDGIERDLRRPITALMVGEIGGANAFTPLLIAGKRGLPVIDADLIGRAFPKLEMNSATLRGLSVAPVWMADALGNQVCIRAKCPKAIEQFARNVAVGMGSSCAFSFAVGDGDFIKSHCIEGSLSRALQLGKAVRLATDPFLALEAMGACLLASGVISDIISSVDEGFLQGYVTITTQKGVLKMLYQNEYLFAEQEGFCLAATPDLLVMLEESSGLPIMSESLRFGLQVRLFVLPASAIWKTLEGLALVGPGAFNYKITEGCLCAMS